MFACCSVRFSQAVLYEILHINFCVVVKAGRTVHCGFVCVCVCGVCVCVCVCVVVLCAINETYKTVVLSTL